MRYATACKQCRQSKRRCARPEVDGAACIHCTRRQQQCSFYTNIQKHASGITATTGVPSTASWPDSLLARLSTAQKLDLVEDYFALIHDRPHSLFHRPTFMADLRSNRLSKSLILGVYALASYLSTDDSIRRLGLEMAEASRGLLLADIGNPALAHIQTAILLATVYAAECEPRTDAMFFAIATRMAQILRLHDRDERADAVTQQTRSRVWWSLVMADYWGSAGLMIQRQLQIQPSNVPLPGPEDEFHAASPHQQDLDGTTPGLWAHMINLVRIFGFIQDLHQELAVERLSHEELDSKVEGVARQLDAWADSLPTEVVLNDQNVQAHISRGLGGPFMALHLGFHHYFTLLFFHALDSHGHHTANQIKFTRRCRGHALSFSRLLQTSRNTLGCEASYATMGHMTVVSSSVLLHMLLFGDDNDLFEAKNSLMGNFSTLMELEKSWPSLGVSMRRLLTFQDACRQPANGSTYRIDQWMFRFLYEHSNPLGDRALAVGSGTSPASSMNNAASPPMLPPLLTVAEGREAVLTSALDTLRR